MTEQNILVSTEKALDSIDASQVDNHGDIGNRLLKAECYILLEIARQLKRLADCTDEGYFCTHEE